MSKVKFIEFSRSVANDTIVEQTAAFKAFYNADL
jgi:hypothetical protein